MCTGVNALVLAATIRAALVGGGWDIPNMERVRFCRGIVCCSGVQKSNCYLAHGEEETHPCSLFVGDVVAPGRVSLPTGVFNLWLGVLTWGSLRLRLAKVPILGGPLPRCIVCGVCW